MDERALIIRTYQLPEHTKGSMCSDNGEITVVTY